MSDTLTSDILARVAVLEEIARGTRLPLERMDARIGRVEHRLDRFDGRMDRLKAKMDSQFRWLLGTVFGLAGVTLAGFGALLGVVAHGFKCI